MILRILLIIVIGNLLGNLNGSILISKIMAGDDIRNHGSGNAGLTNFTRTYGGLCSLLVILIDAAKAAGACLLGKYLLASYGLALEGVALGAVAVGLGHDFPALLGFRGGKGIMCGIASAFVMDWRVAMFTLAIFILVYLTTQYVSLSSIFGAVALGSSFVFWHHDRPWAVVGCLIMCILAIFMHRENIVRLVKGTERKTNFFKKEKQA